MTKTFFLLCFFFLSAGVRGEVPDDALVFETNAELIGFNRAQEEKLHRALDLIKRVVASEEFKKRVIGKIYGGKRRYVDSTLSNETIYKRILEGAEKIGGRIVNNAMDVEVELYLDSDSIALGYTYPHVKRIWMNKKYFNRFRPHQVAGNLFHEWLHKLGFGHAVKDSPSRPHSVPYAIGYLVRDLAKKLE